VPSSWAGFEEWRLGEIWRRLCGGPWSVGEGEEFVLAQTVDLLFRLVGLLLGCGAFYVSCFGFFWS